MIRSTAVVNLTCPECGYAVQVTTPDVVIACGRCRVRLEAEGAPLDYPRTLEGVPAGLPATVSQADAARALNWSPGKLRGQLDRGRIEHTQAGMGRRRYVHTAELARLEGTGEYVDWDALEDLALMPTRTDRRAA